VTDALNFAAQRRAVEDAGVSPKSVIELQGTHKRKRGQWLGGAAWFGFCSRLDEHLDNPLVSGAASRREHRLASVVLDVRIGAVGQKNPDNFLVAQCRCVKQRSGLAEIDAVNLSALTAKELYAFGEVLNGEKMECRLLKAIPSPNEVRLGLKQCQSFGLILNGHVDQFYELIIVSERHSTSRQTSELADAGGQ
jgi:hypothetical protein